MEVEEKKGLEYTPPSFTPWHKRDHMDPKKRSVKIRIPEAIIQTGKKKQNNACCGVTEIGSLGGKKKWTINWMEMETDKET